MNQIPDKLYFKIGEVARLVGVPPYVLRFWEGEFKDISPIKSRTNQRLYRKKDVETVLRIKGYLYEEGFTIEGARKRLREGASREGARLRGDGLDPLDGRSLAVLGKVRKELQELLTQIQKFG